MSTDFWLMFSCILIPHSLTVGGANELKGGPLPAITKFEEKAAPATTTSWAAGVLSLSFRSDGAHFCAVSCPRLGEQLVVPSRVLRGSVRIRSRAGSSGLRLREPGERRRGGEAGGGDGCRGARSQVLERSQRGREGGEESGNPTISAHSPLNLSQQIIENTIISV